LGREPAADVTASGTVVLSRSAGTLRLSANGAELLLDRKTGLIASYSVGGHLLLAGGSPNFYRALTDNDIGTGVEQTHGIWKTASETRIVSAMDARKLDDGAAEATVDYSVGDGAARFVTRYRMTGDGSIHVQADFTPNRTDAPDPLRIGMAFTMPTRIDTMEWYGRGPHESYQDRKTGAPLGLWRGLIADQNHDYMRPQETGNKVDVRWVELLQACAGCKASVGGLRVTGDAPLSINALAFPYDDLSRRPPGTRRSTDIVPHGEVSLMIDAVQAGVGGNTAWDSSGRPMPQYRIPLAPRSFGFRLTPFANDGTHPDAAKPAAAAALR
jgi:beta-galactosidase